MLEIILILLILVLIGGNFVLHVGSLLNVIVVVLVVVLLVRLVQSRSL